MKTIGYVLLALAGLLTVLLLFLLHGAYTPPQNCPPPCDGGAMLIVACFFAFVVFDAPLALVGAWLVFRARSKSAANG